MKNSLKSLAPLAGAAALVLSGGLSQAAITVAIPGVFTHDDRSNFGGMPADLINGSGMNGYNWQTGDPNDFVAAPATWPAGEGTPDTWTATSGQYRDEWQGQSQLSGATNGKLGWAVLDFGDTVTNLESLYLWNIRENIARDTRTFNIYYATAPTVALPGGTSGVDYDFSSGGWTKLNTAVLDLAVAGTAPASADGVYGLSGISAQYLALELMTANGSTDRIGLAEVGVTAIPEPSAALLGALGTLCLLRRRK